MKMFAYFAVLAFVAVATGLEDIKGSGPRCFNHNLDVIFKTCIEKFKGSHGGDTIECVIRMIEPSVVNGKNVTMDKFGAEMVKDLNPEFKDNVLQVVGGKCTDLSIRKFADCLHVELHLPTPPICNDFTYIKVDL